MGLPPPRPFAPPERRQLLRFCLYGFLKNQQYFEPFLILAFREKGFSFTAIGGLIAFRAVCVNLFEIPSGAAADVWGRRRTMAASMAAYMVSFLAFAVADAYWMFFPAMLLFALGEAFRTGTHKAMIFDWLARQGRKDEKTRVYGLTRSWSKKGSALSVLVSAAVVIATGSYFWVFLLAAVPYAANIVNLLCYPRSLDGDAGRPRSLSQVLSVLKDGVRSAALRPGLRALILENTCFEGVFSVTKEYLQPLLKTVALSLPVFLAAADRTRTALLVATVYAVLHLAGSAASRRSHSAAQAAGGEDRLALVLWATTLGLYLATGAGLLLNWGPVPVAGFVLLAVLLNVWKPVLVSRFYEHADQETAATTLSIANQSKTLSVALLAPALGAAVDWLAPATGGATRAVPLPALWPVAAVGLLAAGIGLMIGLTSRRKA